MSGHKTADTDWKAEAERFHQYAARVLEQEDIRDVPDEVIQTFLTMALKLYVRKLESEQPLAPFADGVDVTPTEAAKAVMEMLRAVDMEIFELGLWKSFGTLN